MIGEFKRKGVHLFSLIIPISYMFISKSVVAPIVAIAAAVAIIMDIVRIRKRRYKAWVRLYFGDMFRPHENQSFSGAVYILTGFILAIVFFNRGVAIAVMVCAIVGDTMAAIFGKRYGKIHIVKNKTLTGTLAFLISSFIALTILPTVPELMEHVRFLQTVWQFNLMAAAITTVFELLPIPLDDNLRINLLAGTIIHFIFIC